ncbi:MAG: FAD:protein FMN transferase, partial [Gemmataceae bacterium]
MLSSVFAPEADLAIVSLSRRAMATQWQVLLPVNTPEPARLGYDLFELLDRLESQMTVYRPDSEVSRLNRQAGRGAMRVEARLYDLLQLAGRLHIQTQGCFDAAIGSLLKAWGFFKPPRRVPTPEELEALRWGWQHVALSEPNTVHITRPGVEINLGSIGKGYALDRLVERLTRRWKIGTALLHGGSSSLYAKGDPHGSGRGWAVDIRHPWQRQRLLHRVYLRDRALGTSAATFQHLIHEGKRLGHVLDPRTGWPASGLESVSVLAPSAALADALSTAFFVGGLELA